MSDKYLKSTKYRTHVVTLLEKPRYIIWKRVTDKWSSGLWH